MNATLIAEGATLGFGAAFELAKILAGKKFEKIRAMEMAVSETSSETLAKYAKAKADLDIRDKVMAKEAAELNNAIREYKRTSGFDHKKNEFYLDAKRSLDDFKSSMHYDDILAEIQKDAEDSISAFKASVDYDNTIETLEKEISDAKSKLEAQEKLFANADDDISETAMKLKHAAEDAKNEAIKKATEKKSGLEKQLKTETERFEKKK